MQARGRQPHDEAEGSGQPHGHRDGEPEGDAVLLAQDGGCVRTDTEEGGMPQGDLPRVAHGQVQPHDEHSVDEHEVQDVEDVLPARDGRQAGDDEQGQEKKSSLTRQ